MTRDELAAKYIDLIRNDWFKNHKVKINESCDTTIIEWSNGSPYYYMRFVLDENTLFINSDIGGAVFQFTSKATIDEIIKYDINSFSERLKGFSDDKFNFKKEIAAEYIQNWYQNKFNECKCTNTLGSVLFSICYKLSESSLDNEQWKKDLLDIKHEIDEVEDLDKSGLLNAGKMLNIRLFAYLEALKMVHEHLEQLKTA